MVFNDFHDFRDSHAEFNDFHDFQYSPTEFYDFHDFLDYRMEF